MGKTKATKKPTLINIEFTLARLVHSHAATRTTKPIANEKYSMGNKKTAKAIREARIDAVIIRFINMVVGYLDKGYRVTDLLRTCSLV